MSSGDSQKQALAPNAPVSSNKVVEEEQMAGGDGESIETFCEYKPTALPAVIVEACNANGAVDGKIDNDNAGGKENSLENDSKVVIVLDDDDDTNDGSVQVSKSQVQLLIPSHTSLTCESALLSSVRAPEVHADAAACLLPLISTHSKTSNSTVAALSPLQLEGVLLAIQRHRRIYTASGERAGFFLGDGAGVGKGRQIAAILRDCLCRSHVKGQLNSEISNHPSKNANKRHLWLSVSRELIQDAKRDLRDVGVHGCPVLDANILLDNKRAGSKSERGVLFLTYSFLVSNNRLEQLIAWCAGTEHMKVTPSKSAAVIPSPAARNGIGTLRERKARMEREFSGCIIFDESHKAKNLASDTKTAQLVLELQRRLPKARVVYCSATGVSDIPHMAYAERLGLWNTAGGRGQGHGTGNGHVVNGQGRHYFENFKAFQDSLQSRGLGSLELLALELKGQGSLLARTLSWVGAEFNTTQVSLSKIQRDVYDQAAMWWTVCKEYLTRALKITESNGPSRRSSLVWRIFWSANQRFFRELAICAKVPSLAKDALEQVHKHNRCVVIGLQSTGEAGMQSLLENYKANNLPFEEQEFSELWSTLAAVLTNLVKQHFPVAPAPPDLPKLPSSPPVSTASVQELQAYELLRIERDRIAGLPPPQPIPDLVKLQNTLLSLIDDLELPPNPLDNLIELLGGVDHVAELTGRSGRMVRGTRATSFVYAKRVISDKSGICAADATEEADRINLVERKHFMNGTKSFAIISDAASTGISLHAARGSGASHKRRVHYTLELPWSADKAVQQLGRSHRSGQESAPIYQLVVTELGGERRFAAAVSKRMASLGALTKGDRRAATGGDMLSEFDLDSKYGKRALKRLNLSLQSHLRAQENHQQDESPSTVLPSRKSAEILDQFIAEQNPEGKQSYNSSPSGTATTYSAILVDVISWLDLVGLDDDARSKADVRTFLNRIFGMAVLRQQLVFNLFMSTLQDVIEEAKRTGEFEGTAEDIKAESIEIEQELDLAVDPSSGGKTKLTTLVLDRGISVDTVSFMALEEAKKAKKLDSEVEVENNEDVARDETMEAKGDEWLSRRSKANIAVPGFYISRLKVAGRFLILFAKHKFDRSMFKDEQEAADFDPLGLMVITRPNTGTKLTDMTTRELNKKYRLAISCEDLIKSSSPENSTPLSSSDHQVSGAEGNDKGTLAPLARTPYEQLNSACGQAAKLWSLAFEESDHFLHQNGLAPRRAKLSLVTGPVLHVLPLLEKVVTFRSEKDRALKIMRAQVGSRLIVGVKFPSDEEIISKLQNELKQLQKDRNIAGGTTFRDEDLSPVCLQSLKWATSEPKTMKNFFSVISKNESSTTNSSAGTATAVTNSNKTDTSTTTASEKKRKSPTSSTATQTKKTRSIASFFAPSSKNK